MFGAFDGHFGVHENCGGCEQADDAGGNPVNYFSCFHFVPCFSSNKYNSLVKFTINLHNTYHILKFTTHSIFQTNQMMRKLYIFTLVFIFGYNASMAQPVNASYSTLPVSDTTQTAVKKLVLNMFHAMKQADTVLLKTCFSEKTIFQTILNKPEGAVVKTESVQDFIQSIGKQMPNVLDERIEFGSINVDPMMATVWTPYTFYYKGNYSHKGVNSFQLVKLKEGWKIQYLIDTRYK